MTSQYKAALLLLAAFFFGMGATAFTSGCNSQLPDSAQVSEGGSGQPVTQTASLDHSGSNL